MKGTSRPESEVAAVRELLAQGLSDYEISRRTGIPRSTVLNWRRGRSRASERPATSADRCRECGGVHSLDGLDREAYAYLLAEYPRRRLSVAVEAHWDLFAANRL